MKELILDGFFRCSGCGRRYHLMDTLETEAYCDECGQTLQPEMDEEQEETDDEPLNYRSKGGLDSGKSPITSAEMHRNDAETGKNGPITSSKLPKNSL